MSRKVKAVDQKPVWIVATTELPSIVCPPWCDLEEQTHLADLAQWDGRVVHSGYFAGPPQFQVSVGRTLLPDGSLDAGHDSEVQLVINGTDYTLAEAEEALSVLEDAVATAKEEAGR